MNTQISDEEIFDTLEYEAYVKEMQKSFEEMLVEQELEAKMYGPVGHPAQED
jgi:hypothetical protein